MCRFARKEPSFSEVLRHRSRSARSFALSLARSSSSQELSSTMLIPKKNRVEVYKYLFKEGVLYAKKDFNAPKHPEIDVPNLQVIKLMQSFKSKEYVKENFAWRHYYWFVTPHLHQGLGFGLFPQISAGNRVLVYFCLLFDVTCSLF